MPILQTEGDFVERGSGCATAGGGCACMLGQGSSEGDAVHIDHSNKRVSCTLFSPCFLLRYCLAHHAATQYKLESFTETRSCVRAIEPYMGMCVRVVHTPLTALGESVDGPANGAAPLPWEINVNPPSFFRVRALSSDCSLC